MQTCLIHLIRNTFRLTSKKDWDAVRRDLKPIYSAVNAAVARSAFDDFAERWGGQYRAIVRLWDNAWEEFIPFLDYDVEIRRVLCSTNAIESLNARYRRAIKARGHFPTEQAALKCLYLVTRSLDPTGTSQARWAVRWLSRPGPTQPAHDPSCSAPAGGVQRAGRQIETFQRGLLGREVASGADRPSVTGVQALDGVSGADDPSDLDVVVQERHELRPGGPPHRR